VDGYNGHIGGKMCFKSSDLGGFAGCLAADNGVEFCRWSKLGDYTVNDSSLDAVDDVVACAGDIVTVGTYFYSGL